MRFGGRGVTVERQPELRNESIPAQSSCFAQVFRVGDYVRAHSLSNDGLQGVLRSSLSGDSLISNFPSEQRK